MKLSRRTWYLPLLPAAFIALLSPPEPTASSKGPTVSKLLATWAAVAAFLLPLLMPAGALAQTRLHPAVFALSPTAFPAGSQVVRSGIETNHRLLVDQAGHFGLPPGVLGRRTGYYMDAVEGDQTVAVRTYTSYLVSIFRSARQAQTAYDVRWDNWFAENYFTSPVAPPIRVGVGGAEALFHTLDPSLPPETELFFRRGAVLVEVFQGTAEAAPTPDQLHSFLTIATQLDQLAAAHPRGV
jgi:hypothetical protein